MASDVEAEMTAQICRKHLHQQSLQLCSNLKKWLLTLAQLLKSVFRVKKIESSWLEIHGVNIRTFEQHFYGHSQSHQQTETCRCYTSTLQLDTHAALRTSDLCKATNFSFFLVKPNLFIVLHNVEADAKVPVVSNKVAWISRR